MNFGQRITTVLETPSLPLTWDSILQECSRIESDYTHIQSEFKWALDYKRFQVEVDRGNRSSALQSLKAAIAAAPYNSDIVGDYKNYVAKAAIVENIVLIVSSKKTEANAIRLAGQLDKLDIQYLIVSGSDASPIGHIRALQVDASDSHEALPQKVAAAFAWIYENLGTGVGVLKVSDDMALHDAAKLRRSLSRMAAENGYAGVPVDGLQLDRCAHWGKCRDLALNRRVYGRPALRPWASGNAYYLGARPLEKVVLALMRFPGLFEGEYYEDKLVGDVLVFEDVGLTALKDFGDFGLRSPDAAPVGRRSLSLDNPATSQAFSASGSGLKINPAGNRK